jgi:hypothetical protein
MVTSMGEGNARASKTESESPTVTTKVAACVKAQDLKNQSLDVTPTHAVKVMPSSSE